MQEAWTAACYRATSRLEYPTAEFVIRRQIETWIGSYNNESLKPVRSHKQIMTTRGNVEAYIFVAPSHPHAEATKLLCPHHKGAGSPHPIRVRGPDLWYQMALVDTTVEQSLVSSAGGGDLSACTVRSVVSKAGGWEVGRVGCAAPSANCFMRILCVLCAFFYLPKKYAHRLYAYIKHPLSIFCVFMEYILRLLCVNN